MTNSFRSRFTGYSLKLRNKVRSVLCTNNKGEDNCHDCKINRFLIDRLQLSLTTAFNGKRLSPEEQRPLALALRDDYMKLPDYLKKKAKEEIWPDWQDTFEALENWDGVS